MVAGDIGGGNYPFLFDERGKFLGRAFETQPLWAFGVETDYGKDFSSHPEQEVVFPLDVLGCAGEGKAKFAQEVKSQGR